MRIALVAGEASGDLLGAGLIRAIRARIPDAKFEGVAGPAMVEAGCVRIEDAEALAVCRSTSSDRVGLGCAHGRVLPVYTQGR